MTRKVQRYDMAECARNPIYSNMVMGSDYDALEALHAELKVTINRVSADRDHWYKTAKLLEAQVERLRRMPHD